jgi:hypothetical protein
MKSLLILSKRRITHSDILKHVSPPCPPLESFALPSRQFILYLYKGQEGLSGWLSNCERQTQVHNWQLPLEMAVSEQLLKCSNWVSLLSQNNF